MIRVTPPISPPRWNARNQKINKVDLLLCVKHTTHHRSPPDASLDLVTIDLALNYTRIRLDVIKITNPHMGVFNFVAIRERKEERKLVSVYCN